MCQWEFYFQCGRKISTQMLPWNSNLNNLLTFQGYPISCQQLVIDPWCIHKESSEITFRSTNLFFLKTVKSGALITLVMPDHSVSILGLSSETNELSWWLQSKARVSQASCELRAQFLLLPINLFQFYIHSSLKHLNSHQWLCSSALDVWGLIVELSISPIFKKKHFSTVQP